LTEISAFFKESNSSLGIFYPTHYIVASFPSEADAGQAYDAIRGSGLAEDEVLRLSPSKALSFFEDFQKESGTLGEVMTGVSRALGDDATFADDDINRARRGSGFVFVHATTDAEAARIRNLVAPYRPQTMHWYLRGGIQSLI
jgi:hypothetical protein